MRRSGRWRGSFATDCRAASFGSRERMLHSRVPYVRRMRAIPNRLTATAGQILERSLTTAMVPKYHFAKRVFVIGLVAEAANRCDLAACVNRKLHSIRVPKKENASCGVRCTFGCGIASEAGERCPTIQLSVIFGGESRSCVLFSLLPSRPPSHSRQGKI